MRPLTQPSFILLALALAACGGGGGGSAAAPAALSGVLTVPGDHAVDSDTNDSLTATTRNDSLAEAQALPNPVTLGGFLGRTGTGSASDRFGTTGDADDYYRVTLEPGDLVTLSIAVPPGAAPSEPNFDLSLLSTNGTELLASRGQTATETLTVPGTWPAGVTYYLRVQDVSTEDVATPTDGRTESANYNLVIGNPAQVAAASGDFVPGEIVVVWRTHHAGAGTPAGVAVELGIQAVDALPGQPQLMRIDTSAAAAEGRLALGIISEAPSAPGQGPSLALNADRLRRLTLEVVRALRANPEVRLAEPNHRRHTFLAPSDPPLYSRQWHYPLINLPAAWDITTGTPSTGATPIVAVIDTGIVATHPDFAGKLVSGYDFISNLDMAGDGDGIDPDPSDPGDFPGASSFHGTHVAGTIGAASNNGLGVAGVSWGARIMPLRALGRGGGTSFDVLQAVRYAAGLPCNADPSGQAAPRASILNLSLGGSEYDTIEEATFAEIRQRGVIVIAAAGNDATARPSYPAGYPTVISVGAITSQSALAYYSNFGALVDLVAPGGDMRPPNGIWGGVISTGATDQISDTNPNGSIVPGYYIMQGTSMAAPHVAGVVALMRAANPALMPAQVETELALGNLTVDLGTPGRDDVFGHGRVDAFKAVQRAQALVGAPPRLVAHPAALQFGCDVTSQPFLIDNGGGGSLTITSVTTDQSWLSVEGSGTGSWTARVQRAGLAQGTHRATITAASNTNTATISVRAVVSDCRGNAGTQYVLVLHPGATQPAAWTVATLSGGAYAWSIPNLAPGSYFLMAGSDLNNDRIICDTGESCGVYTLPNGVQTFDFGGGSLNGLNFGIRFDTTVAGSGTR